MKPYFIDMFPVSLTKDVYDIFVYDIHFIVLCICSNFFSIKENHISDSVKYHLLSRVIWSQDDDQRVSLESDHCLDHISTVELGAVWIGAVTCITAARDLRVEGRAGQDYGWDGSPSYITRGCGMLRMRMFVHQRAGTKLCGGPQWP